MKGTVSDRPVTAGHITKSSLTFQTAEVSLTCGDVLTLATGLEPGTVDAVITDPPYCSGAGTTSGKSQDPITKYCQNNNACGRPTFTGDARDQRSYAYWCTLWLSACRMAAKPSAYCLVFSDWRQLPTVTDAIQAAGWHYRGVISWNKGRGARSPHKGYFRHQCEFIAWATNGPVPKLKDRGPFDGCFDISVRQADKFHITGKPTDLMRQLVQAAPVGGTVLDPFSGSGTTLVAAQLEGRKAIGFELSPEYFAIAVDRLQSLPARAA